MQKMFGGISTMSKGSWMIDFVITFDEGECDEACNGLHTDGRLPGEGYCRVFDSKLASSGTVFSRCYQCIKRVKDEDFERPWGI
jgi:hypothetical protein